MAYGDCDTCVHLDRGDYCLDCDFLERVTFDKYEEASPESQLLAGRRYKSHDMDES